MIFGAIFQFITIFYIFYTSLFKSILRATYLICNNERRFI